MNQALLVWTPTLEADFSISPDRSSIHGENRHSDTLAQNLNLLP